MTHARDYEDDDIDGVRDTDGDTPRRSAPPRFGPFLTIAVAILMLFGAASRFGKTEAGGWLNLDFLASKSLEQENLRLQEQRNTTLITLGAVPVPSPIPVSSPAAPVIRLDSRNVMPPPRGEFDLEEYQNRQRLYEQRTTLSLPVPTEDGGRENLAGIPVTSFDPAPEAEPVAAATSRSPSGVYVVAEGDNWVKIGKQTGKKWQDIQRANPASQEGLRVGMKLVIPES